METRIKHWLVVLNLVTQDYKNEGRYYALFYWNKIHRDDNVCVKKETVKKNGKLITILTIKVDGSKHLFDDFCDLASEVNGLYCIDDILSSVEVVNEYNKR